MDKLPTYMIEQAMEVLAEGQGAPFPWFTGKDVQCEK